VTKLHIETTINGEPREFLCDSHETLLSALRNGLGLTGTKEGCATGDCGACSILLDGRLVPACLVLAPEAQGRAVTTIEGLSSGDALHPLQQKFLEHAALQCGVCTPGFIVAAKALLDARTRRGTGSPAICAGALVTTRSFVRCSTPRRR